MEATSEGIRSTTKAKEGEGIREEQELLLSGLLVLFNSVGVPLLTRKLGGSFTQPPLPLLGLLSAVYTSSDSLQHILEELECETHKIAFKMFDDSLLMVLCLGNYPGEVFPLLDVLYEAFILLLGRKTLMDTIPNDRITKDLRGTVGLVDKLMESPHFSFLLECVELYPLSKTHATFLKEAIDHFVELIGKKDVLGCCILLNGRVCSASDSWWQRLHWREIALLLQLATSINSCTLCVDIPVFLPYFKIGDQQAGFVMF